MNHGVDGSVLLIGGSGVVGMRAARALRRLQPELPIVIAGRDAKKAHGVASATGGPTTSLVVDLGRDDLGLPEGAAISAVAVFVKDSGMSSMRYAQDKRVPYLAFSDFSFDIAPAIGLFVHEPKRARKAYNNIWAEDLLRRGRPRGAGDRFALPIAGDDPQAKAKIMALTNALGFDAVDAGGIDDSWRQQPGTPVYTANLDATGTLRALADARSKRSTELSGTTASPGSWIDPR